MNDNRDIPADPVKSTKDSAKLIQDIVSGKITFEGGKLEPSGLYETLNTNIAHLEFEKEKGYLNQENLTIVEYSLSVGKQYIIDNPENGGGGNSGIIYFTDCYKGFIFAIDFGGQNFKTKEGEVYYISVNGYNGCATVSAADKKPITYNGFDYKNFDPQSDCVGCMRKFGIGQ
jgi:hypothetical protein